MGELGGPGEWEKNERLYLQHVDGAIVGRVFKVRGTSAWLWKLVARDDTDDHEVYLAEYDTGQRLMIHEEATDACDAAFLRFQKSVGEVVI